MAMDTASWRVLRAAREPAARQFALSEALLSVGLVATKRPALRWYVARQPVLILGNGQKPEDADLAASREAGVEVFRRTSGGTAVLLDEDAINLEIALPAGYPLASSDLARSYQWAGEVWVEALHALGIAGIYAISIEEVRALPPLARDDPLRLACYGTLSPFEVVAGQRKVVGLSQVRRRAGALYQMSAYLRWRPERLAALLALSSEQRESLSRRLRDVTVGLDELAGRDISAAEVTTAVEAALVSRLGITLKPGRWTPTEREAAARIEAERFTPVH
jgi:lipoate---protein ligase